MTEFVALLFSETTANKHTLSLAHYVPIGYWVH